MIATCGICGETMPRGEEMFQYHGASGPCPKPAKPITVEQAFLNLAKKTRECEELAICYGMKSVSEVFRDYAKSLDEMSTEGKTFDEKMEKVSKSTDVPDMEE